MKSMAAYVRGDGGGIGGRRGGGGGGGGGGWWRRQNRPGPRLTRNWTGPYTGQSIYQLGPSPEWTHWGFPVNSTDGWVGHPRKHELNVGGLLTQLVFACPPSEPIEVVSIQLGPEISGKRAQVNFTVSDFDILVPVKSI